MVTDTPTSSSAKQPVLRLPCERLAAPAVCSWASSPHSRDLGQTARASRLPIATETARPRSSLGPAHKQAPKFELSTARRYRKWTSSSHSTRPSSAECSSADKQARDPNCPSFQSDTLPSIVSAVCRQRFPLFQPAQVWPAHLP